MAKTRTELIHCDNCGEDYAATYRRCPFCDAKPGQRFDDEPDYEEPFDDEDGFLPTSQGGKRLAGGRRSGPGLDFGFWIRIALYAVSAIIILAAIWIMCTMVIPKLFPSGEGEAQPSPLPSETAVSPQPSTADVQTPASDSGMEPLPMVPGMGGVVDDPLALDNPDLPPVEPDPIQSPAPVSSRSPASEAPVSSQTPASEAPAVSTSASLNLTDFSINAKYPDPVRLKVTGGEATGWSSSNGGVATVSENGTVTGVGNGTATITCTLKDGGKLTCTVRVSGKTGAAPAPSATPAAQTTETPSAGSAKLSSTDFSINAKYPDPVRLKVTGGEATGWASSNGGVATVSENGTVTGVGNGTATITCTLKDGGKLTCTVRVSGK